MHPSRPISGALAWVVRGLFGFVGKLSRLVWGISQVVWGLFGFVGKLAWVVWGLFWSVGELAWVV